jgi:hypothetical protein
LGIWPTLPEVMSGFIKFFHFIVTVLSDANHVAICNCTLAL